MTERRVENMSGVESVGSVVKTEAMIEGQLVNANVVVDSFDIEGKVNKATKLKAENIQTVVEKPKTQNDLYQAEADYYLKAEKTWADRLADFFRSKTVQRTGASLSAAASILTGGLAIAETQQGEVPSEAAMSEYEKTDFEPLTQDERAYLYEYLTNVSKDTVSLEELKPLIDRGMLELFDKRYSSIKQELMDKEKITDSDLLEVEARVLFGSEMEAYMASTSSNQSFDFGSLNGYQDKIKEFFRIEQEIRIVETEQEKETLRSKQELKFLRDSNGIPRIFLPGLEDKSDNSEAWFERIKKNIKTLQDRAPEGVDVVKWLWDLGLDEYFICVFDKNSDYMSAFVTNYGRVSSNFKDSDLENENLDKMMMTHWINESYSIAYARINEATLYKKTWSVDTAKSETIKYWAMSKNAAFLLDVSGLENKDLEFVMGASFYLASPLKSEQEKLVGQRMYELLIMMAPSVDVGGVWDRVDKFEVK